MHPFRGPGSSLGGVTTPAGIGNKVEGGVVCCLGMTLVDGFGPAS